MAVHTKAYIGDCFQSHTVCVFTEGFLGDLIENWVEGPYLDSLCTVAEEQTLYSGCRERHLMVGPGTCCGGAGRAEWVKENTDT